MSTPRLATPVASSSTALFKILFTPKSSCRHALSQRSISTAKPYRMSDKRKMQTSTYQSYTLDPHPMPPPRSPAPETSISAGIPQFHDTRPPQMAGQMFQKPASPVAIPEKEAQASKPTETAKPKSRLRPRKAAIKLSPTAVEALRDLLNQPEPKLIKVGVKNRGCSGLAYNLEYVDKPGKFDEMVEQDGVKVLIDSKALFSIIGSEMDWVEDKLNQRFVFHNPNIKEQCGCGESFMV